MVHRSVVYHSVEMKIHHRVVHRSVVYHSVEQETHLRVVHRSVVYLSVELYKSTQPTRVSCVFEPLPRGMLGFANMQQFGITPNYIANHTHRHTSTLSV